MTYLSRTVQRRTGRRAGTIRWTIGVMLTAGLAIASLFWNADGGRIDRETWLVESYQPPNLAQEPEIDSSNHDLASRHFETGESESLARFVPRAAGSRSERDATGSHAEKSPVSALAQFGNRGPGGFEPPGGGGNRHGAGGPGNGNQLPGGGSQVGGAGQGAGGVCIATKIQLEPNATAGLTDRHNKVVLQRPAPGRFFSD